MKVVMFTPGLAASAIGRMASLVTQALLAQGHQVDVVRTEDGELLDRPAHAFGTQVLRWTDRQQVERLLSAADLLVYQVGDNFGYHRGCLEFMRVAPGVVCLHDFFLGHLFTGWAQGRREQASLVLRAWYGEETARSFFGFASSEEFISATREAAPMTEWVASLAHGVVTHSSWGVDRVAAACGGPVRIVPLPYAAPAAPATAATNGGDDFQVLTVGNVNPNKRAESIISAIGASDPLRTRTVFRLVGAIQPAVAQRLNATASAAGVRLEISGEASDEVLAQALARADVVCCLRWPTLEAASASTIEAMLSGKAVVVEDTGFYAELPDDCVAKVRPEHEVEDLRRILEQLAGDAASRRALGQRAATWAHASFNADNYARELIAMGDDCRRAEAVTHVVQSVAQQLNAWGGLHRLVTLPQTASPLQIFDAKEQT